MCKGRHRATVVRIVAVARRQCALPVERLRSVS